jgi:hypothetical protein
MANLCQGNQYPGRNQLYFCKLKADIICLVKWIQGNKRHGTESNELKLFRTRSSVEGVLTPASFPFYDLHE